MEIQEIDNMKELIKDLQEYASDDEELNHISIISQSIDRLKEKTEDTFKKCQINDQKIRDLYE